MSARNRVFGQEGRKSSTARRLLELAELARGEIARHGKSPEFVAILKEAASLGDRQAMLELGVRLTEGKSVVRDNAAAVAWFRKAAKRGSARAQYMLGLCYESGTGVRLGLRSAFRWYSRAVQGGIAEAEIALGRCYFYGRGIPRDYSKAMKMWRRAASSPLKKPLSARC